MIGRAPQPRSQALMICWSASVKVGSEVWGSVSPSMSRSSPNKIWTALKSALAERLTSWVMIASRLLTFRRPPPFSVTTTSSFSALVTRVFIFLAPGGRDQGSSMWPSGTCMTLRWTEPDSNFRYRGRRPACGRSLRAQRVKTDPAKREFGSDSCLLAPPCGGSGRLGGGLCFPFPTPEDGQQESRLAPIGRHLVRLLRGGVLRTGCFPRQAAFQGGHEIDDGRRGRDLPGFNGEPLHLGFEQFSQGLLVTISIRRRIETSGPLRDDRLGDRDHLGVELAFGHAELRRPNLLCGTQSEKRHPCAASRGTDG